MVPSQAKNKPRRRQHLYPPSLTTETTQMPPLDVCLLLSRRNPEITHINARLHGFIRASRSGSPICNVLRPHKSPPHGLRRLIIDSSLPCDIVHGTTNHSLAQPFTYRNGRHSLRSSSKRIRRVGTVRTAGSFATLANTWLCVLVESTLVKHYSTFSLITAKSHTDSIITLNTLSRFSDSCRQKKDALAQFKTSSPNPLNPYSMV